MGSPSGFQWESSAGGGGGLSGRQHSSTVHTILSLVRWHSFEWVLAWNFCLIFIDGVCGTQPGEFHHGLNTAHQIKTDSVVSVVASILMSIFLYVTS